MIRETEKGFMCEYWVWDGRDTTQAERTGASVSGPGGKELAKREGMRAAKMKAEKLARHYRVPFFVFDKIAECEPLEPQVEWKDFRKENAK